MRDINSITGAIIGAAMAIHTELGPGLFESVYEVVLAKDLQRAGFDVERQKEISFEARGILFERAFRLDLLVDDRVIVEVKCDERLHPVHYMQLNSYLRLTGKRIGLLINFGEARLKDGIKRLINGYEPTTQ